MTGPHAERRTGGQMFFTLRAQVLQIRIAAIPEQVKECLASFEHVKEGAVKVQDKNDQQ